MNSNASLMEAIELLQEQSAQVFPFSDLEQYLQETRSSELCEILGISNDLLRRFKETGLSVDEADRMAIRVSSHPCMIWDGWLDIEPIPDEMLNRVEGFMEVHKQCATCHEWKDRSAFYRRSASSDGLSRQCKGCTKIYETNRKRKKSGRIIVH